MRVRRLEVDFSSPVPGEWVKGDPFLTHLLNAFSTTFPPGEEFFKRSVRKVAGPVREGDVRAFLAQESLHSKVHGGFNSNLDDQGLPIHSMQKFVTNLLKFAGKTFSPKMNLSITCALEHMTALFAEIILESPDFLQDIMDPRVREMWAWHSIEELEHKSLAFDLYQKNYGDYKVRAFGLLLATSVLAVIILTHQTWLLRAAGKNTLRVWLKGLAKVYLSRTYLKKVLPYWASYFRADFHPDQHDTSDLMEWYDKY